MCMVLNADYLLATILSTKERVAFRSLRDVRNRIQSQVRNVVVDISSPGIFAALEDYPEIFEEKETEIARAKDAVKYLGSKYLEYEFTNAIPEEIHRVVQDAIAASVP